MRNDWLSFDYYPPLLRNRHGLLRRWLFSGALPENNHKKTYIVSRYHSGVKQMIINTSQESKSHEDGEAIRSAALMMNVTLLTTLTHLWLQ